MSRFEVDDLTPNLTSSRLKYSLAMDAVLILLGLSTIWIATQYLSLNDPRPLQNAWTYIIGVPLGLVLVDAVFRTIVSRFIERAVQVAFLLSMFVHLLLTMGAIHTKLFARGEAEHTQSLTLAAAKQEQQSSIPEFVQTAEMANVAKPDYLRPAPTGTADASSKEAKRQDVEHDSKPPALAKVPDTQIEMPEAKVAKVDAKIDDPEIRSEAARLDRPELAPEVADTSPAIEIPEGEVSIEQADRVLAEVLPTDMDRKRREIKSAVVNPAADQFVPNPISTIDRELSLSKAPQRIERSDFELPAIEDRKTELAKRDLSTDAASRVSEPSLSRVPLLDVPRSMSGEVANQLPTTSIDKPSELGDRMPSIGLREQSSAIGGSVARSALEGVAEAGAAKLQPGSSLAQTRVPTVIRQSPRAEEVSISGSLESASKRAKPNAASAPLSSSTITIPRGNAETQHTATNEKPSDGISASVADSKRRTQSSSSTAGRGDTLRGLTSALEGIQPSTDLGRAPARSIAASRGKKLESFDLDTSIDSLALPGPKRLPRLQSAAPTPNAPAVPIPVPAFQQRMSRNEGTSDAADLGELGPATEAAIERGLEFLAKHQRTDGSWRLEDFGDKPRLRSHTAATALSLLAFQGAGYSHRQYHYAPVCKSALEYLLANQQPNGDLYIPTDEESNSNARFYSHSIASLALCEAFGMTQDEALREPAQRAVQFMVKTQDPVGGGWRYQPGFESDTSVSGWFMMALKSAELSGLEVPPSTFNGIKGWLDKAQVSPNERHLYRYNPFAADTPATRHGRVPNPTMTGVGLLMRLYLGWRRNTNEMAQGADYLLENLPAQGTVANPKRDTYYWYYATQVLFHMGGERWKQWNGALYPLLIQSQILEGEQFGSWDPAGPIPDRWGPFAGRLYVTTLNLLSLEVYYRHLPIYEDTAK